MFVRLLIDGLSGIETFGNQQPRTLQLAAKNCRLRRSKSERSYGSEGYSFSTVISSGGAAIILIPSSFLTLARVVFVSVSDPVQKRLQPIAQSRITIGRSSMMNVRFFILFFSTVPVLGMWRVVGWISCL
jgi:hypothetical protein